MANPFFVTVPMYLVSDHWSPRSIVILHSDIEVGTDDQFVPWGNAGNQFIHMSVEFVFLILIRFKGWSLDWDEYQEVIMM